MLNIVMNYCDFRCKFLEDLSWLLTVSFAYFPDAVWIAH